MRISSACYRTAALDKRGNYLVAGVDAGRPATPALPG
jgi:hypothetical protein